MLSDAELKRIAHQAEIQTFLTESLRRFERAILSHVEQRVRAEEREACAKVCEGNIECFPGHAEGAILRPFSGIGHHSGVTYAAAIRARTQEKP